MTAAGNRIRELRKLRNLTQEQLAEQCDISVSTLCRWEGGTLRPNDRHQKKLAEVLGVDVNTLFVFSELALPSNLLLKEILQEAEALTPDEQRYVLDCIRGLRGLNHSN